ncbi:MAG: cytochrome b/b6 domain-containing protein [Desulfobulbaceae bacterium]|nr:cytochrome b/b6 domain-containing protein [Desulfobulbaceae bacterium]
MHSNTQIIMTEDSSMGKKRAAFNKGKIDVPTKVIHIGIMIFALAAYVTGDGADDYKKAEYFGYILHQWLGMGISLFILLRIIYGLIGADSARFSNWVPYTRERLRLARDGLMSIFLYRKPRRPAHQGIAGLINAAGLAIFAWMAVTGSILFFFLEPGRRSSGLIHFIEEIHEVGETLVPAYLVIHIGAVIIHALYGRDIWRKMFFIKRQRF